MIYFGRKNNILTRVQAKKWEAKKLGRWQDKLTAKIHLESSALEMETQTDVGIPLLSHHWLKLKSLYSIYFRIEVKIFKMDRKCTRKGIGARDFIHMENRENKRLTNIIWLKLILISRRNSSMLIARLSYLGRNQSFKFTAHICWRLKGRF